MASEEFEGLDPEVVAATERCAAHVTDVWRAVEAALPPALYAALQRIVRWQVDEARVLGRLEERFRRRRAGGGEAGAPSPPPRCDAVVTSGAAHTQYTPGRYIRDGECSKTGRV
jgi:hypothetical protein